jgi:hypothetical protein
MAGPRSASARAGAVKIYRGAQGRLRRITLRGNWSPHMWAFIVVVLIVLFVLIPAILNHSHLHR